MCMESVGSVVKKKNFPKVCEGSYYLGVLDFAYTPHTPYTPYTFFLSLSFFFSIKPRNNRYNI